MAAPRQSVEVPFFTDENVAKLFGAEAAEDETEDRFRQYFFYNQTYDNVRSPLPLRILVGHKGVGKSALLKRAYLSDRDHKALAIWLRPGDVSAMITSDISNFSALVEYWKQGILRIIAEYILGEAAQEILDKRKLARYAAQAATFIRAVTIKLAEKSGIESQELNSAIVESFKQTGAMGGSW